MCSLLVVPIVHATSPVSVVLDETRMSALGASVTMDPTSGSRAPSVEVDSSSRSVTDSRTLRTGQSSIMFSNLQRLTQLANSTNSASPERGLATIHVQMVFSADPNHCYRHFGHSCIAPCMVLATSLRNRYG
jgi:hypothetical protein